MVRRHHSRSKKLCKVERSFRETAKRHHTSRVRRVFLAEKLDSAKRSGPSSTPAVLRLGTYRTHAERRDLPADTGHAVYAHILRPSQTAREDGVAGRKIR